jgi:hypothetical protein
MENKIVLPQGFEIDLERSKGNEVYMREIPKKEAKTWEEIQKENLGVQQYTFSINGAILSVAVGGIELSKTHIPSVRIAEKIRALCQMHLIAEYYNRVYGNNWVADYKDGSQVKYYAVWDNEKGIIGKDSHFVCSDAAPVFGGQAILMMAYENNKEIFKTALKP